jgi:CheY-like chemotaxis protein
MPKVQVVVIDDDTRFREVLVEILESAGYVVVGLGLATEALARLDELDPDLVLLDMMMPGMDGFEFLARLRKDPRRNNVRVIISSALGGTLERAIDDASARTLGISGVLTKPVEMNALLEQVRAAIGPAARGQ